MRECFPKHSRMGTARMKTNAKKLRRGVSINKRTAGMKERSSEGLSVRNQNTILINIIYYFT